MATKVKKAQSAPSKSAKKPASAGASAKSEKKSAPEMMAAPATSAEADEDAEEEAAASASSGGGGGNAAALAAAGSTEMSASFKNFRHHPDMENFYRFIYENDLRYEALLILDELQAQKLNRKAAKSSKSAAH